MQNKRRLYIEKLKTTNFIFIFLKKNIQTWNLVTIIQSVSFKFRPTYIFINTNAYKSYWDVIKWQGPKVHLTTVELVYEVPQISWCISNL